MDIAVGAARQRPGGTATGSREPRAPARTAHPGQPPDGAAARDG